MSYYVSNIRDIGILIAICFNIVLLNQDLFLLGNRGDQDQLASDEAILSGSYLFPNLTENMYAYNWFAKNWERV